MCDLLAGFVPSSPGRTQERGDAFELMGSQVGISPRGRLSVTSGQALKPPLQNK